MSVAAERPHPEGWLSVQQDQADVQPGSVYRETERPLSHISVDLRGQNTECGRHLRSRVGSGVRGRGTRNGCHDFAALL